MSVIIEIPRQSIALTRYHIASIKGILVFQETKAIHKLDFGDFASAISVEMVFNIRPRDYGWLQVSDGSPPRENALSRQIEGSPIR